MPATDHEPQNWLMAKVANLVWRFTPKCKEVARLTSEGREHPLPLGTRARLGLHRLFCKWCARYAAQIDLLHEASHRLPDHDEEIGGPQLRGDARERMKRALRGE